MGYVDLIVKILEIILNILVILSKFIMWLLPWRIQILEKKISIISDEEKVDGKDRKFVKAEIHLFQGLQTLLDIPFLLLSVIVLIIAPWRIHYFLGKFKTTDVERWRAMIFGQIFNSLFDLPFVVMFLVICCSIFMPFKLKRRLMKK